MTLSASRLQRLALLNNTKKYLEVGVQKGETFFSLDLPFKKGVDPNFLFDYKTKETSSVKFVPTTSDIFFQEPRQLDKYDLIFLDGLHIFEQTLRDFCSSLEFSHKKTIWLLDDVRPRTRWEMVRSPRISAYAQKVLLHKNKFWVGDVFKVLLTIHDFFPQFSFATFPGHGQSAIWYKQRSGIKPCAQSLRHLSGMTFHDYLQVPPNVFNFQEDEVIYKAIADSFAHK